LWLLCCKRCGAPYWRRQRGFSKKPGSPELHRLLAFLSNAWASFPVIWMKMDVSKLRFEEIEELAHRLEKKGACVSLQRQGESLVMVAN